MSNLVFEDREGSFHFNIIVVVIILFLMFWVLSFFNIGHYYVMSPLVLYLFASFVYRKMEKNRIQNALVSTNSFVNRFKFGPDQYGTIALAYGQLVFTRPNGKTVVLLHSANERNALKLALRNAVSTYNFKCVVIHKGLDRYVLPVEVWNAMYEKIPPFDIQSDYHGEWVNFKRSPLLYVAVFALVAFFPVVFKVFFNIVFGSPILKDVSILDYSLVGLSVISSLWHLLRKKNHTKEEELHLDPCVLSPDEVKGFSYRTPNEA